MGRRFVFTITLLFVLAGCSASETTPAPTATFLPPTNTPSPSCENIEESCLELAFDGENCTYGGPTEITPGPVRLFFHNESDEVAAVNFAQFKEGKTYEDLYRHFGYKDTTSLSAPPWRSDLGTWKPISAGTTKDWVRLLKPGNYYMVCARMRPFLVWLGTGLTVEE